MPNKPKKDWGSIAAKAFRCLTEPNYFMHQWLKRSRRATYARKVEFDAVPRPHYAYGVYYAALQAKSLGIPAITAIEFGVAGGQGLFELEDVADAVKAETGVDVHVYGFGMAVGMPVPQDHRDLPYVWTTGLFKMPLKRIRERLRRAQLVLGDVANTVPTFVEKFNPPPVGFVAIDVDYYSSSVNVLKLFDSAPAHLLPRIFCYLDDCIGDEHELHSPFAGELLAVDEFNQTHPTRKMAPIFGLRHKRRVPAAWNDVMFVLHNFDHPLYNTYTNSEKWKPSVQVRPAAAQAVLEPTPAA